VGSTPTPVTDNTIAWSNGEDGRRGDEVMVRFRAPTYITRSVIPLVGDH
jgi:hypothetical protein